MPINNMTTINIQRENKLERIKLKWEQIEKDGTGTLP